VRAVANSIKVVFASPFREIVGGRGLELAVEGPLTVREILERLVRQFPPLEKFVPRVKDEVIFWGSLVPMKDDKILKPDAPVQPGETLYFYPPLSGG